MENIYYSVQHRIFVLRLFWSLLLIPHSLPNLSLLCTRHTKIVKLPHLRCYQRRYFRVAKVGSWQCLKIQKHERKKCYIHSHSTYVAPTLQIEDVFGTNTDTCDYIQLFYFLKLFLVSMCSCQQWRIQGPASLGTCPGSAEFFGILGVSFGQN
jgi:hypothetical protein